MRAGRLWSWNRAWRWVPCSQVSVSRVYNQELGGFWDLRSETLTSVEDPM